MFRLQNSDYILKLNNIIEIFVDVICIYLSIFFIFFCQRQTEFDNKFFKKRFRSRDIKRKQRQNSNK